MGEYMNKRKILIAEDNTEISDMMRNYLLKAEYSVYQAYDGLQAIEMASSVRPDLMLLDIMMPVCEIGRASCRERVCEYV